MQHEPGRTETTTPDRLAVVVPVYNEAAGVTATLQQLAAQRDQNFECVFVDNASTDGSRDVIEQFAAAKGLTRWHVIDESRKGTGAAADTGMRHAIALGATMLARTDADCLPRLDWTSRVRLALTPKTQGGSGLDMVAGLLIPRRDEGLSRLSIAGLVAAVRIADGFGVVRPSNYGDGMRGVYVMAAGCNMGIRAETYIASGGFPRSAIEDLHEDHALVNAVRRLPDARLARGHDVVVRGSSRRVQAWGLRRTLLWYKDHAYRPSHVDIR